MASENVTPASEKLGSDCRQLASMVGIMNNLRKQGALCDVTLVAKGKRLPAHRVVLASASEFFRLMFMTEMMESVSHEVKLEGAEPEIIKLLIDFIYTSKISVNDSTVQSLLHAANQYQIDPVKVACADFLKGQIDETNCLGISALAEFAYCPKLKAQADHFAQRHFNKVSTFDEFLQLDIVRLTGLLQQDQLGVREEQIYEAAQRWLMHSLSSRRQYLVEVFSCIRFPLISKTFLSSTVCANPLIQDNPQCLNMLISGMRCHLLNWNEDLGKMRPRLKQTYRVGVYTPLLCRYFRPEDSSWIVIHSSPEKHLNAAAACWDGVLYILGGSCISTPPVKHMSCYNVQEESWFTKPGLPTPRSHLAACVIRGKIYASGGTAENLSSLDVFESYDIRTDSWHMETSMSVARRCHGSVELDGLVYVCGGMVGDHSSRRILNSLEVYSPNTEQWRALCGMKQARKNHGLVVVRDRIYALGGQGPQGKLRSVEYYDISSDEWRDAAPMPWLGLTVKCAAVDDIIYVLAGRQQGVERLRHVLEFYTETDRWVVRSTVQAFPISNCTICPFSV